MRMHFIKYEIWFYSRQLRIHKKINLISNERGMRTAVVWQRGNTLTIFQGYMIVVLENVII